MQKSQSITELAKALSKFQGMMTAIPMDATNPFFKSKYATLHAIVDAIREPLAKCGLSVSQLPYEHCGVATILMHESGEWISSSLTLTPSKQDPQGLGAAISYARRFALSAVLGLVTQEDTDGNETVQRPAFPKSQFVPAKGLSVISEAQRKRLFAVAKENGLTKDQIKPLLTHLGFDSSKDITIQGYDKVEEGIISLGKELKKARASEN